MNRFSYLIAGLTVLVFGLVSVSVFAGGTKSMSGWSESEMIGQIVRNPQGEYLGQIGDVAHDSQGRIFLVALNQYPTFGLGMAWRRLAIPFSALHWDTDKGYYVLDATRERLAFAPDFRKEDINDQEWVAGVYRFYGLQPSWTEEESTGFTGHPGERWTEEYQRMETPYHYRDR